MSHTSKILVIDDDTASCRTLELHFRSQGRDVELAHNVDEGMAAIQAGRPDVVVLDIRMPGRSGLEGLPEFKKKFPNVPIIMITAYHDMESTIRAMQGGADDYIHKPIDIDELDAAVERALLRAKTGNEDMLLKHEGRSDPTNMMGRSRAMKEVFKAIGLVAPKPVTVLITGESGTGKELVARAIHRSGAHPDGPFIAVNCAALVETLLESDLFGHEKGAFTGAVTRQPGKFALAKDGTIFLDEVSELSASIQAKLLRVLQEREYLPVGGSQVQATNARVIAATNADLNDRVKQNKFREDLFYRLQVVTINIPPLRERLEDLPDLAQALLVRINQDMHRKVTRVASEVMKAFHAYHWPGNVRELENVLLKSVAMCPSGTITRDFLPSSMLGENTTLVDESASTPLSSLQEVEKRQILRVLQATDWHRGRTCEILDISRPRLRRLMRQYDLDTPSARTQDGASDC